MVGNRSRSAHAQSTCTYHQLTWAAGHRGCSAFPYHRFSFVDQNVVTPWRLLFIAECRLFRDSNVRLRASSEKSVRLLSPCSGVPSLLVLVPGLVRDAKRARPDNVFWGRTSLPPPTPFHVKQCLKRPIPHGGESGREETFLISLICAIFS